MRKRSFEARLAESVESNPRNLKRSKGLLYLIDYFEDPKEGARLSPRERKDFTRDTRKYINKRGFDGDRVLREFLVYVLVKSKCSVLSSVKKTDYPKKSEIGKFIKRIANKISENKDTDRLYVQFERFTDKIPTEEPAFKSALSATFAASFNMQKYDGNSYSKHQFKAPYLTAAAAAHAYDDKLSASRDYAAGLIDIMRKEAQRGAGRKTKMKRVAKPGARGLIKKCRSLWDKYCEKSNKTNLRAVLKHLDAMKESDAKTVASERTKCLRVANQEAKRLGVKK